MQVAKVTEIPNPLFAEGLNPKEPSKVELVSEASNTVERSESVIIDPFRMFALREKLVGRIR